MEYQDMNQNIFGENFMVVNEEYGKSCLYIFCDNGKAYRHPVDSKQKALICSIAETVYELRDCNAKQQYSILEEPSRGTLSEDTNTFDLPTVRHSITFNRDEVDFLYSQDIRFSLGKVIPDEEDDSGILFRDGDEDDDPEYKITSLKMELSRLAAQLRDSGVPQEIIDNLVKPEKPDLRLHITSDYRILLPDFDNKEVVMGPLPRALYILLLRHYEGIYFKELSNYRDELFLIYQRITDRSTDVINSSIDSLVDPTNNSANEKRSQANSSFKNILSSSIADTFSIIGSKGKLKRIDIDPDNVTWEE